MSQAIEPPTVLQMKIPDLAFHINSCPDLAKDRKVSHRNEKGAATSFYNQFQVRIKLPKLYSLLYHNDRIRDSNVTSLKYRTRSDLNRVHRQLG